jgi:hypothetical protein
MAGAAASSPTPATIPPPARLPRAANPEVMPAPLRPATVPAAPTTPMSATPVAVPPTAPAYRATVRAPSFLVGQGAFVTRSEEDHDRAEEARHEAQQIEALDGPVTDEPAHGSEGGHDAGTAHHTHGPEGGEDIGAAKAGHHCHGCRAGRG